MREILQKIFSFSTKTDSRPKKGKHKPKGQSLVELTLALPALLILFSGLVEFGFMLNYYLSLLDATRYAARFYSNLDPTAADPNTARNASDWFYADSAAMTKDQLEPRTVNDTSRKIKLDPAADDVIITAYSVSGNSVVTYPGSGPYHMYNTQTPTFTTTQLQSQLVAGAPCAGVLVVEVAYSYHQVLALPWLAPFVPNPVVLHAYTVMPLQAIEPHC